MLKILYRIKAITENNKQITYDYYADGMIKTITYPLLGNGEILKVNHYYDSANRLSKIENVKGNTIISKFEYDHDLNGNINK